MQEPEPTKSLGCFLQYPCDALTIQIGLFFTEVREPLVQDVLSHGAGEISKKSWVCQSLMEDLKQGFASERFGELWFAYRWPKQLEDDVIAGAEPYLFVSYGLELLSKGQSPWAFIWLPTFYRNPNVLGEALTSIGNHALAHDNLLEEVLAGRGEFGPDVLASTSERHEKHLLSGTAHQTKLPKPDSRVRKGSGGQGQFHDRQWINERIRAEYHSDIPPRSITECAKRTGASLVMKSLGLCSFSSPVRRSSVPLRQLNSSG
jgi:hypothetical protein